MNFIQHGSDGGVYMGEDTRDLFVEKHADKPDENIWLGYQESGSNPMDEQGIPKQSWFQHTSIFGTTGKGKSTLIKNMANQVARKGHGFVMIDPKGDMAQEMVEELPEDRLDDVIWIEPGAIGRDKVAAINFLEASVPKGHPRYDREVESIVSDLQAVLRAGDYWGKKMEGITKNITRAMVRSENPYTLYDMYNVLVEEEKRWNFVESLQREDVDLGTSGTGDISEDVKQYSKQIARMDDEEIDPVVRRLQDWAESPISKEIVAHRYSTVNIDEAVNDGKIILLKNSVEDRDTKRIISTAIMRRVWVAIQARAETVEEEDRDPYFAFIDEFDDVVSEDMDIDKMLSKARSGKMSVTLACQNPSQIKEDHPNILTQIFNNTDTMISFAVRDPNDGALIARRMGEDFDESDMQEMPRYRVVTRLSYIGEQGPQISPPIGLRTFPDYPPLRTSQQAEEAIEASLDQYGVEPMESYPGETDLLISGGGLQEQTVTDFLELVWNEHYREDTAVVNVESIADRFEQKVGEAIENYPKGIGVPKEMIDVHNVALGADDDEDPFGGGESIAKSWDESTSDTTRDDEDDQSEKIAFETDSRIYIQKTEAEVSITPEGIDAVLQQDSGRSQPTPTHRKIIYKTFKWFARLGFYTEVPIQMGATPVCDAEANLPIDEDIAVSEMQDEIERFQTEYPLAAEISDTSNINLEAEGATQSKPAKTIENVLRGIRQGRKVVLAVKDGREDGHGQTYYANRVENILTSPPFYREDREFPPGVDPRNLDDDDDDSEPVRVLYNKSEKMRVGNPEESQEKFAVIPAGKQTVWVENGEKILLYDGRGPEANKQGELKYSETEFASSNAMEIWCRYDAYQKEWVVYPGGGDDYRYDTKKEMKKDFQFVYKPLLIGAEVDEAPDRDDWSVLIFPEPEAIPEANTRVTTESTADDDGEESYELDLTYPENRAPLVYEDGQTRRLIPEEYDHLLTPPEELEYTDSDSPAGESAASTGDETATDETTDTLTMDSFEQIELEREAKQILTDYQKDFTGQELERYDEVRDRYGAKVPAEIDFWRGVWDEFNRAYDTGIPEAVLPDAIRQSTGLTKQKAADAIDIGVEFDLLVADTPTEPLDIDLGDEETIYRLVLPEERPDLYLDDPHEFADKRVWDELWEFALATPDEELRRGEIINGIKAKHDLTAQNEAEAAIGVGALAGAIEKTSSGYTLAADRPAEFWLSVWENVDADLASPLPRRNILRGIRFETADLDRDEIEACFESALEHNELYSPEDADDGEYAINDPASEDGPEIIDRDGNIIDEITPDDNDDDSLDDTDDHNSNGSDSDGDDDDPDGGSGPTPTDASTDNTASDSGQQSGESTDSDTGSETDTDTEGDSEREPTTPTADASNEAQSEAATDAAQSATEQEATQDDPQGSSDGEPESAATADGGEYMDADKIREEVEQNPPSEDRVQAAFSAAIEFFHEQIDTPINSNKQWNADNPDARYQKPETAREYFQHPRHDEGGLSDSLEFMSPDGVTVGSLENHVNKISGDARKQVNDYLPKEDTAPVVNSDPLNKGTDDAPLLMEPYAYQIRENRGWAPETIEAKQLGWAPTDPTALYKHLREQGFSKKELLATGLFYASEGNKPLRAHFVGRYVFPYFNAEGEPVYAISRSIDTDRESFERVDPKYDHKYTKAIKNPDYSMIDEPIYGLETIHEGQPLVITEGMADAISAHEQNIPCISPVTKKFKAKHHDLLKEVILENNIPEVYIIQDADPAEVHDKELDDDEEVDTIREGLKVTQYGPGFAGAADTARYLDTVAKREYDANAGDVGDSENESESESSLISGEQGSDTGPTVRQVKQTVKHSMKGTPSRAFETYIIPLPRYGGLKYDLDDYLTDKLGILVPPALWAANNTIDGEHNGSWVDQLHDDRQFRYFDADQYRALEDGEFEGDHPLPAATIQNHLPTIAPSDLPREAGSGRGGSIPNVGDRPDGDWNPGASSSSDTNLFDLTMFDVFGLSEGFRGKSPLGHYGDSENYFVVLEDDGAYCHKRDVWYNPATAILCLEDERPEDNPYGEFSPEEKLAMWEHVRKKRIKRAQIPNDALKYYAFREGIATEDDLVEEDGPYGKFMRLRARKYHEAVDKLTEDYEFEIVRDTMRNEDSEDSETNPDSGEAESEVEERSAPADDTVGEGSISAILGSEEAANEYIEGQDDDSNQGDDPEPEDELTRFRTYCEPDLEDDDVDVDRDAVKQFVEEFAEVGEEGNKQMKTATDDLISTFTSWCEINNVGTDIFTEEMGENTRKGELTKILESEFTVEKARGRIDQELTTLYRPIELSEDIVELL